MQATTLIIDGKDTGLTKKMMVDIIEKEYAGQTILVKKAEAHIAQHCKLTAREIGWKKPNRNTSCLNEFVRSCLDINFEVVPSVDGSPASFRIVKPVKVQDKKLSGVSVLDAMNMARVKQSDIVNAIIKTENGRKIVTMEFSA